jgi:hypothetical protein
MLSSPKKRRGTVWDRLLAMAFVAFFIYLLYLAMTGRLDAEVNTVANWLKRLFSR